MKFTSIILFILFATLGFSQTSSNDYESNYIISFKNAIHHEANIKATFSNLDSEVVALRMSRTSPGRYALHEFAKNVYDLKITDSKGKELLVTRPNPHEWNVSGHDGTIIVSYILFADRGDGTYSQIDETHAHLNIPATFMFIPAHKDRAVSVRFDVRKDLKWKVATQLIDNGNNNFSAPNLQYFMDSPVEISNHTIRKVDVKNNDKTYTIRFVLHHNGSEQEVDTYFEKIKKIVAQEKAVFGEYPDFDHGEYTFLACYIPNASGDGMEHRNSTILTSTRSLADGGMESNIGTVSHEFFHAWNVERIRPQDLEPFNFEKANMSEALWFAEGFTSYYTNLILCRAGVISREKYIKGLARTYNYVWNSPARKFFNPIEMSYQAPFVDAAKSVDPVNRGNTFISYYSYGSMLGLALDLSLRNHKEGLHLDDYMKLVWNTYGKIEKPYTVKDLHLLLETYAGTSFANDFFQKYIYDSQMPNYESLFASVGVLIVKDQNSPYHGASLKHNNDRNELFIDQYTQKDSPAHKAGLDKGDILSAINEVTITNDEQLKTALKKYKPGDKITITYNRLGKTSKTELLLENTPVIKTALSQKPDKKTKEHRDNWLKAH
ncbi:M61 family metallopeptidase [Aquimarina sp. AU474]|uniref:M61 family metallopeptidase n=1 Tax=Aquimarina sp. AU474 TaxID=2108529 RepID=UPI000D69F2CD|nr:PDZ domain-containing protein [Aquimarina sp. AU474]